MEKVAAIYARVSSNQQKEQQTIQSQTAALVEYAKTHGYLIPSAWQFQDDGYSGATLVPGSVVNFPIFDRNCPKIRYSPQNICSSRSIFHNLSFSPPGVLIYEFDGVSHSPTFG